MIAASTTAFAVRPRPVARRDAFEPAGMYPGLVTVRSLALRSEVSVGTVHRWLHRRTITGTRFGWTWRMWGPTVARQLADTHDVGCFPEATRTAGPSGYVDTATLATWLGVSEASARQLARTGDLPSVRVGKAFRFHWPTLLKTIQTTR